MNSKFYAILFAIAMVVTLYYNGLNVQIAKYISMVIYAFLFVMSVVKRNKGNMPKIFKSWMIWLVLAGVVNFLMIRDRANLESLVNLEIAMPLMVAFSAYSLLEIKREILPYYMLPVCVAAAYFAYSSVLSGLGGFVVSESYDNGIAKNQIGATFSSMAIICLVFLLDLKRPVLKIGYGALSVICLYPAVYFACRTALLAYLAVAAILLFRDYKFKGLMILGALIGAYALFASDSIEAILYDSVVGRRDSSDLDDLTSGRITHATKSLAYFLNHPFLGFYGSGDSFNQMPPNAHIYLLYRLTKWGILGAIPFIALYLSVFKIMIRSFRSKDLMLAGLLLLAIIESFSEYAPPFGPGSCFIVAFIFVGYYLRNDVSENLYLYNLSFASDLGRQL